MKKFHKSIFEPRNIIKYIGRGAIICRSSWERTFCIFLDNHPSILQWASEPIRISYTDPLTSKTKGYYPDFLIVYEDKNKIKHSEIIEIKPAKQAGMKKTKSAIDKAQQVKNFAKWDAAQKFCEKNGLKFRVITENQMFGVK